VLCMEDVGNVGGSGGASRDLRAEEVFIAQMKHRRSVLNLSQGELSDRVSALGGHMYQQTIAKLEAGQRSLKLSEADVLARALGTTVQEMLSSVYGDPSWARLHVSRDMDELEREVAESLEMLRAAEAAERAAAERAVASEENLKVAQVAAMAARHALQSEQERRAMLAERYQHYAAELAQWRELEQRTGKRHRPRKRGGGFVPAEEPKGGG
jgi:transcriptional regulator with XRE-family HTH domain